MQKVNTSEYQEAESDSKSVLEQNITLLNAIREDRPHSKLIETLLQIEQLKLYALELSNQELL